MSILSNKIAVLTAIESAYGTDPGSGYTGVLVNQGSTITTAGDKIERSIVKSTFTPEGHVITSQSFDVTLTVELKGGGIDGTLQTPEMDALLRCCALTRSAGLILAVDNISGTFTPGETISTAAGTIGMLADVVVGAGNTAILYIYDLGTTPGDDDAISGSISSATADTNGTPVNSYVYKPTSDRASMASMTMHFHSDGIRYVATGVRGNCDVKMTVNNYGMVDFTFMGLYASPTDQILPTPGLSSINPPPCLNAGLKIGDTAMDGISVENFNTNLNNNVIKIPDINSTTGIRAIEITDRAPTGTIDPDQDAIGSFDPYTAWINAQTAKIYAQIGNTAGNRIRMVVPAAQYDSISTSDRNGLSAYSLPFVPTGDTDDEFFLIFS